MLALEGDIRPRKQADEDGRYLRAEETSEPCQTVTLSSVCYALTVAVQSRRAGRAGYVFEKRAERGEVEDSEMGELFNGCLYR